MFLRRGKYHRACEHLVTLEVVEYTACNASSVINRHSVTATQRIQVVCC